jgi:hypothetical protein
VSCSLVLVSENTSRLNNVLSSSLTPRDLLRVPKWDISLMVMDMNHQVIKEKNGDKPAAKDSNLLLTEKKGLGVLDLDIMVLPLSVDGVILEHVCLQAKIKQNVSHKAQLKKGNLRCMQLKRKLRVHLVIKEMEGICS